MILASMLFVAAAVLLILKLQHNKPIPVAAGSPIPYSDSPERGIREVLPDEDVLKTPPLAEPVT